MTAVAQENNNGSFSFDNFLNTVGDLGESYLKYRAAKESDTPYNVNPETGEIIVQGTESRNTSRYTGFFKEAGNIATSPMVGNMIAIGLAGLAGFLIYKAVT